MMVTASGAVLFPKTPARTHAPPDRDDCGDFVVPLVCANLPNVTAAADDQLPSGGGAGIVVDGSDCTLTTIGHGTVGPSPVALAHRFAGKPSPATLNPNTARRRGCRRNGATSKSMQTDSLE